MVAIAGGLLQVSLTGLQGGDTGGAAVPHHLQRGGGYDSEALDLGDGRGSG